MSISEKLKNIWSKLEDTKLLAVSKTRSVDQIQEIYNLGQRDFGENKVQELFEKAQELEHLELKWHFIGHLQSNKINQLLRVRKLVAIHSIDSIELLNKLLSKNIDKKIGLFLQVNISQEEEKHGFLDSVKLEEALLMAKDHPYFYIQGLMGMGKIRTDHFEVEAHKSFQKIREIKDELSKKHDLALELSIGMSQDYEIALTYGSDWVRIGTQIFGPRD